MRPFTRSLLLLVIAFGVLFSNAGRPGVRRKLPNVFASPAKVAAHNYWLSQQMHVSKKQSGSVKGGYIKLQPRPYEYSASNAFDKTQRAKKVVVVHPDSRRKEPWWKAEPPSPAKGKGAVSKGKEYPNLEDYFWWQDDSNGKGKGVVAPKRPSMPPTRAPYAGLFPTMPPASTVAPTQADTSEPTEIPTTQPSVSPSTLFPTPELSETFDPTPMVSSEAPSVSETEAPSQTAVSPSVVSSTVPPTELPTNTSTERSQQPSSSPDAFDSPTVIPSLTSEESARPSTSPISLPISGVPLSFQPSSINTAIPSAAQTEPTVPTTQDSFRPSISNTVDPEASAAPTPSSSNTDTTLSTVDPEASQQPTSSSTDTTLSTTEPAASPLPTPGGTQQPTTLNTEPAGQVPTTDPDVLSAIPTPPGSLLTAPPTAPGTLQSGPPTPFETVPPALSTNPTTGTTLNTGQPSSSNTDSTLTTVDPVASVAPTPGGSPQPTTSNTDTPLATTEPASNSIQPGQDPTNDPVASAIPTPPTSSLQSAPPTPPSSLLSAPPTPLGSLLQSGPPTPSETVSPNTPSTLQPTSLILAIETIPIEASAPSTSPRPSGSNSEGPLEVVTDGEPGINVHSTPFVVDYITKGEPSQEDIREAQSITYSYLSDYLFSQIFQNPAIIFIGESVTAVRTTTTASAIRIEYEFVGIFSEGSKLVPSMGDIDRKILLAFSQPAVQALTIALHDLPKDNPFSETSDISFVISNVPPLGHTMSEPPQETENEVFSLSALALAMLGIFLGVVGLGLILMRRTRRRRYKDISLYDVTAIQERIHANGNNDATVRQYNTISVEHGGGDDAAALLHHTVPSASTASIPMSTNSAIIQGERQISNEQSAAFLLPVNHQHPHDSKTSNFKSLSKDSSASGFNSSEGSFPPTAKREIDRDYSTWVQKTYSQRGYSEVRSDED